MQTVADMRGVGVKNREKFADVLCGRPLTVKRKKKMFIYSEKATFKNKITHFSLNSKEVSMYCEISVGDFFFSHFLAFSEIMNYRQT